MINPTFTDIITVYHQVRHIDDETQRSVTKWQRQTYTECFFDTQMIENTSGNTLSRSNSYTARIPFIGADLDFAPGDIVVRGEVTDDISDVAGKRVSDLKSRYKPGCFTVQAVKDNTKSRFGKHYKLTGV